MSLALPEGLRLPLGVWLAQRVMEGEEEPVRLARGEAETESEPVTLGLPLRERVTLPVRVTDTE